MSARAWDRRRRAKRLLRAIEHVTRHSDHGVRIGDIVVLGVDHPVLVWLPNLE